MTQLTMGAAVRHTSAILALGAAVAAAGVAAAAPKQDAQNGAWTVFVDEEGGKTCYMVSRPTAQSPTGLSWDPVIYVMRGAVTSGRDEPSVRAGYQYQDGSTATASVGSDTFTMFTDKDGAWILEVEEERRLVEAMKKGSTMVIKGTSSRGNLTTDTYSLSGVTAGLTRINELCP